MGSWLERFNAATLRGEGAVNRECAATPDVCDHECCDQYAEGRRERGRFSATGVATAPQTALRMHDLFDDRIGHRPRFGKRSRASSTRSLNDGHEQQLVAYAPLFHLS